MLYEHTSEQLGRGLESVVTDGTCSNANPRDKSPNAKHAQMMGMVIREGAYLSRRAGESNGET